MVSGTKIFTYTFKNVFNENSKIKNYIDFIETPFYIDVEFIPTQLQVNENMFSICNHNYVLIFQLNGSNIWNCSQDESTTSSSCPPTDNDHQQINQKPVQLHHEVDYGAIKDQKEINDQEFNVKIGSKNQITFNQRPEIDSNDLKPTVISELQCKLYSLDTSQTHCQYDIFMLLQLKLSAENITNQLSFKCLEQKPLFIENESSGTNKSMNHNRSVLESKFHKNFYGCHVLVTTQQDGFLYLIQLDKPNTSKCVVSFPFTSQLIDVSMDEFTVQAITENGLEVYTMGTTLFPEMDQPKPAVINKPVSLIDLRPFSSVNKIMLSNTSLVLLAATVNNSNMKYVDANSGVWTVYNLTKPSAQTIYRDFESLARKKYQRNRDAFTDIMEEANTVLKRKLKFLSLRDLPGPENSQTLSLEPNSSKELLNLYNESCILLGDLYLLSSDDKSIKLSLFYYRNGGYNFLSIVKRFITLYNNDMKCAKGLVFVIQTFLSKTTPYQVDLECLSTVIDKSEFLPKFRDTWNENEPATESDETNEAATIRFGEVLIDLLLQLAPTELSNLLLLEPILFNFMTNSTFEHFEKYPKKTPEDNLCLIIYLNKRNYIQKAKNIFQSLSNHLPVVLRKHYKLFFDVSYKKGHRIVNFSDFSETFFLNTEESSYHETFIDICLYVILDVQFLDFETVLNLFMDYLSLLVGQKFYMHGQNIVMNFLEKYFLQTNFIAFVNPKGSDDDNSLDVFSSKSDPNSLSYASHGESENANKKSVRLLIRFYLSHLKYEVAGDLPNEQKLVYDSTLSQGEDVLKSYANDVEHFFQRHRPLLGIKSNKNKSSVNLFEERHSYFGLMPPFEKNLLIYNTWPEESTRNKKEVDSNTAKINLIKLQSLLCRSEIANEVQKDVTQFVQANPSLIGSDSIHICFMSTQAATEFLLDKCPQVVLQFASVKFNSDQEWVYLIKAVQLKINKYDADKGIAIVLFYRLFKGNFINFC